ncbi:hypothetical protein [Rhizobium sp. FKY42]|uniref:hypothetical protein n=1 Tax=Rhizobium sp. FKY42 TaxID=2562310 RepID=UPI0010C1172B|nr:hypothetical protein [Rhizobium sp. FKY42]
MDLESVRGFLPSMTRERMGEEVTLTAMKEGKMGMRPDPDRAPQTLKGRMDAEPQLEQLGGGRERPGHAKFMSDHRTVSFAQADLIWPPDTGCHLTRTHPITKAVEHYRIDRTYEPYPGNVVCDLSRI